MASPAELTRFLRRLRAVRSFTGEPVAARVVEEILRVARWSGSSENGQPWRFLVVERRETLRSLSGLSPTAGHVAAAALAILVVLPDERPIMTAFDDGRATERIMLAAAAHGLGSSIAWLGKQARPELADLLGLPEGRIVRTVIAIGHPAPEALRPKSGAGEARRPLRELVHRERW